MIRAVCHKSIRGMQLFSVTYKHREWWLRSLFHSQCRQDRNQAVIPNILPIDPLEFANFGFPHESMKSMVTELKFNTEKLRDLVKILFGAHRQEKDENYGIIKQMQVEH